MTEPPLWDRTAGIYNCIAGEWDRDRARHGIEAPWIDRVTDGLPRGAAVLDLGCGAGDPVATDLAARGFAVWGLDAAAAMLRIAQRRVPQGHFVLGDMRHLDLGRSFAAIIGWDSFFHLRASDQRSTLPRIGAHLASRGRLLLTVGPEAGEAIGAVAGHPVYHASLALAEYEAILAEQGIRVEDFRPNDPDTGGRSLLLCRRSD